MQISVHTVSGAPEIHAHWNDVMIVQQGSATLIAGGEVIDPATSADGEIKGSGIRGGKSHAIAAANIFTVNAGVPHQLQIQPGKTCGAVVIKIKE